MRTPGALPPTTMLRGLPQIRGQWRRWPARLALVAFAAGSLLTGCRQQELSGQDLQALKRDEIIRRQGTLTGEQQLQIGTISARTRSEFEQKVKIILSPRARAGTGGTSGSRTKNG